MTQTLVLVWVTERTVCDFCSLFWSSASNVEILKSTLFFTLQVNEMTQKTGVRYLKPQKVYNHTTPFYWACRCKTCGEG